MVGPALSVKSPPPRQGPGETIGNLTKLISIHARQIPLLGLVFHVTLPIVPGTGVPILKFN